MRNIKILGIVLSAGEMDKLLDKYLPMIFSKNEAKNGKEHYRWSSFETCQYELPIVTAQHIKDIRNYHFDINNFFGIFLYNGNIPDGEPINISENFAMFNIFEPEKYSNGTLRTMNSKDTVKIEDWSYILPTDNSMQDIINEMQMRIGMYLPEDFDWESHIGTISYDKIH